MVKWSHYIGRRKKDPVRIFVDSSIKTYDSFVRYCKVRGIEPASQEYFDNLLDEVNASREVCEAPLPVKKIQALKEKSDPAWAAKNNTPPRKPTKSPASKKKRLPRDKK